MKLHRHTFKVTKVSPIIKAVGRNNKEFDTRIIGLLDTDKLSEPEQYQIPHDVMFRGVSIKYTQNIQPGQYVLLDYNIAASLSKSKVAHTHIVPRKITIIPKP